MNIGLYFGTFNPIHVGHLIIANHMAEYSDLDEVWMAVTPHNPFKKKATLLDNYQRYEMVFQATEDYLNIKPTDIEFGLPQPSYTVNTLAHIQEKYPQHQFSLIMGEDNLQGLHKWKNHELLVKNHDIYVYPRVFENKKEVKISQDRVHFIEAPIVEISSTQIRKAIKAGKNVQPLLPKLVWDYVDKMNLYKK
ncbi:nicotinate (nicotinamide) nucleotide adenylyltransferase [Flavicella sediminum]|uniref:nicotinate (nicotinamide) nucleotide adenylyltransferase n=1 Tax=Flavicella sediminum TaxID=2585141 RepID=UPI00111D54CB|nr:nicotinate (nicotinamide) nucleotide adenylyltransferase [Flavicella sediminum]